MVVALETEHNLKSKVQHLNFCLLKKFGVKIQAQYIAWIPLRLSRTSREGIKKDATSPSIYL